MNAWAALSSNPNPATRNSKATLRVLHALARYAATREGDVKRLQDVEPPKLRLRVGDYRVRFHDLSDSILVLAAKHRRETYR